MGSGWVLGLQNKKELELRLDKYNHQYLRFNLKVPAGTDKYHYFEIRSWEPAALWLIKNLVVGEWIQVIGTLMQETVELESRTGKPRIRLWTHIIARDIKKVPSGKKQKEIPWSPK